MGFDEGSVFAELDAKTESIQRYLTDDDELIQRYTRSFQALPDEWTAAEIREELSTSSYPGALPSPAFDNVDSPIRHHSVSDNWESHEAVNDWARDILRDVPMLSVDGSEIPPTTQFNVPIAYVQAAWTLNHHSPAGHLERGREGQILTPEDITRTAGGDSGDEYRFVEESLVGLNRYEHEAEIVVERIEALAESREAGDLERPPVVLYDGPLVVSFANPSRPPVRDRYRGAMSRILAASAFHKIPVVGYVSGTNANELAKMTRLLMGGDWGLDRLVPDAQILTGMMSAWGDSTIPFVSQREASIDSLRATYNGNSFDFGNEIHFSYLKVPPGAGLDRLEFPGWLLRTDGPADYETLYEYVLSTVRAEAGIGRGYPEVIQQADTDAVLDQRDRERFLNLVVQWAEENGIPLEWDAKALSKERRRR